MKDIQKYDKPSNRNKINIHLNMNHQKIYSAGSESDEHFGDGWRRIHWLTHCR